MASRSVVWHSARAGLHSGALKRPRGSRRLRRASATCNSPHQSGHRSVLTHNVSKIQRMPALAVLQRAGRAMPIIHSVRMSLGKESRRRVGYAERAMAHDYYPLMARAVSSLEQNTSAGRQAVYKRARRALREQVRDHRPALSHSDRIDEMLAL